MLVISSTVKYYNCALVMGMLDRVSHLVGHLVETSRCAKFSDFSHIYGLKNTESCTRALLKEGGEVGDWLRLHIETEP